MMLDLCMNIFFGNVGDDWIFSLSLLTHITAANIKLLLHIVHPVNYLGNN